MQLEQNPLNSFRIEKVSEFLDSRRWSIKKVPLAIETHFIQLCSEFVMDYLCTADR